MKMIKIKVLSKIFRPKRKKIRAECWIELPNEGFHFINIDFRQHNYIIKKHKLKRHVST